MCGLCGAIGGEDHWTANLSANDYADERRRQRRYRIQMINKVLQARKLSISDFQSTRYVLTTATGKSAIVDDLSSIWQQTEAMTSTALDPLDINFLDALAL